MAGSSTLFDARGSIVGDTGSSTLFDTREALVDGRFRSSQIAFRTLTADRLILPPVNILNTITNYDLTQTRTFDLYTAPLSKIGIVIGIFVQAVIATNVTVAPQISLGVASGENDIFPVEPLTGFDTTGNVWSNWLVMSKARLVNPAQIAVLSVTAATADKLLANIRLVGFEYSN